MIYNIENYCEMRLKLIKISFVASIINMVISVSLFYNLGVYVDEVGTTPSVVNGGIFWLYMDWLRLLISFLLVIVLGMTVVYKKQNIHDGTKV